MPGSARSTAPSMLAFMQGASAESCRLAEESALGKLELPSSVSLFSTARGISGSFGVKSATHASRVGEPNSLPLKHEEVGRDGVHKSSASSFFLP